MVLCPHLSVFVSLLLRKTFRTPLPASETAQLHLSHSHDLPAMVGGRLPPKMVGRAFTVWPEHFSHCVLAGGLCSRFCPSLQIAPFNTLSYDRCVYYFSIITVYQVLRSIFYSPLCSQPRRHTGVLKYAPQRWAPHNSSLVLQMHSLRCDGVMCH